MSVKNFEAAGASPTYMKGLTREVRVRQLYRLQFGCMLSVPYAIKHLFRFRALAAAAHKVSLRGWLHYWQR